jgi:hypothetical protein
MAHTLNKQHSCHLLRSVNKHGRTLCCLAVPAYMLQLVAGHLSQATQQEQLAPRRAEASTLYSQVQQQTW